MVLPPPDKVSQEQLYDMLLSRELSWQEIILGLIASEQLDPWDIDLGVLSSRYLERIRQLEESSFFISSKVLLAASLLLRIKSEILLNKYLKSLDEILFGKPEKPPAREEEEFVFNEILPDLLPKTPLPRLKKVTLNELMQALERAINTEHRRIRKEIAEREVERNVNIVLPRSRIDIRAKIKEIYLKIKQFLMNKPDEKLAFSVLAGPDKTEKISTFIPLLYLENQSRILLEQQQHFAEIYILLRKHVASHDRNNPLQASAQLIAEYEAENEEQELSEQQEQNSISAS